MCVPTVCVLYIYDGRLKDVAQFHIIPQHSFRVSTNACVREDEILHSKLKELLLLEEGSCHSFARKLVNEDLGHQYEYDCIRIQEY